MAANKRTDDRRVDTYHVGDTADAPKDGHLWVDSANTNQISVFRGGAWVTPRLASPTFTGTTTVTTLTATTVNTTTLNATGAVTFTTPAASATGFVRLGTGAVPTTATSTSGILQVSALPGTPVGQSAVPTTSTIFLTFDTTKRQFAINIAGSWFTGGASMELY